MIVKAVYFSPTGTTKKIVTEIAKVLDGNFKGFDITNHKNRVKEINFDEDDIVIVGAPVYSGRLPSFIADYFESLEGSNNIIVPIVVYGNREYEDALLEMNNIFLSKGFKIVAGGAFIGEHSYTSKVATNRPDDKDLEIARSFAVTIKEKLTNKKFKNIEVKGNYPYRERKESLTIGPKTLDSCTDCKICVECCPTGAISSDPRIVDESKCIKCFSCVRRCPSKSKYFDERLDSAIKWLVDNCSEIRKEPELFI